MVSESMCTQPFPHVISVPCCVAPVVQFSSPAYNHVREPLSNSSLDLSTLTLALSRVGDASLPSLVAYATRDESAIAGRDYAPSSGSVVFETGQVLAELVFRILANPDLQDDSSFTVHLSQVSPHTNIGANSTVIVAIANRDLLGPYFPALPQLCSVEEEEGGGVRTCSPEALYFDLPLLCITVSGMLILKLCPVHVSTLHTGMRCDL